MVVSLLGTVALAGPLHTPNSLIGVAVGVPEIISLRGEAWMSGAASFEIGGGIPLATLDAFLDGEGPGSQPAVFDAAIRWRPRFLCVGGDGPVLATFGLGIGTVVTPDVDLLGPWTWAAGPDVVGTLVVWTTPTVGLQVSARAGAGPEWQGTSNLREFNPTWWAFGTLGIAF